MTQRRKKPVPTLPGDRLKQLLMERNMKQSDLCSDRSDSAYRLHKSEISELCNHVRPLTEEKAQDLINHFFPDVCLDWLMGRSEIKTQYDKERSELWNVYLAMETEQLQTHCLEIFMESFGYTIEEHPKIDRDMSLPDLQKAMQIYFETGKIAYKIYKDGELIKELTIQEMVRLKAKIGRAIALFLEP